ncbi:MAG TPA: cytochrome P460 family protein [Methylomirabilota bacterium]
MRFPRRLLTLVPVVAVTLAALAVPGAAGPDKIRFPANWKDHVLYTTVDRYDIKQHRELYASTQAAVDAMRAGRPLPDGTVLTLIQYKAQVDAAGNPVKDAKGRFVKGDLIAHTVMEKRKGWGTEYPDEWRNGEWEYAAFNAAGALNEKANYKACFQCHKPHEKADYVISLAALRGTAGPTTAPKADVKIAGFVFGPNKHTGTVGQPVTWVNEDASPHQITIVSTKERSPILLQGQSHAMGFNTAGTYEYICGLHPTMKGSIEVK